MASETPTHRPSEPTEAEVEAILRHGEENFCTCGAGHGSLEGHLDWCDWTRLVAALRAASAARPEPVAKAKVNMLVDREDMRRKIASDPDEGPIGAALPEPVAAKPAYSARDAFLSLTDQTNWGRENVDSKDYWAGYSDAMDQVHQHVMDFWPELSTLDLPASPPASERDAVIEAAAIAGWNACRKSIYAVCEDIQERAADPNKVSLAKLQSEKDHERGYYFGEAQAAKSIARGFNAMEATDDDNFTAALRSLRSKP